VKPRAKLTNITEAMTPDTIDLNTNEGRREARRLGLPVAGEDGASRGAAFSLPIPPSTNNLFATVRGGRRVKSRRYQAWIVAGTARLREQGIGRAKQPASVTVTIKGGRGFNRARDGDNTLKPILDLLVSAGVLTSDRFVDVPDVRAVYREDRGRGAVAACEVRVATIEEVLS